MPVATSKKNGLMSTSAFNVINSMIGAKTSDVNMIVKLTISGKINLLCGCVSNYHSPRLFSILGTSNDNLPRIKSFYAGKSLQFYGVLEEGTAIHLYINGLSSWGSFSIVPFCGNVNSIEAVAEIPDNVEALEFIE